MTTADRIDALEKQLRYLTDRQEILDCVARNARGCDRHDSPLLSSAYHLDGIDEHGAANTIATNINFTARPSRYWAVQARFRSYLYDNQTPEFETF